MSMIHVSHEVFQARLKETKEDDIIQTSGIYCGAEDLYGTTEDYTVVSFHPKQAFEDGSFDEIAHMVVTVHGDIHYFVEDGRSFGQTLEDAIQNCLAPA